MQEEEKQRISKKMEEQMILTRDKDNYGDICIWEDKINLILDGQGYWNSTSDVENPRLVISTKQEFKEMFPGVKMPRKGRKYTGIRFCLAGL